MQHSYYDADGFHQRRSFEEILEDALGFNRITPYMDQFMVTSNLRYGTVLAAGVAAFEAFMIMNSFIMSRDPNVVARMGWDWIIHHRISYGIQMVSALILVASFFVEKHRRRNRQSMHLLPIKLVIAQFIIVSFVFGIYISCVDLTRDNGIYSFLTQATGIVCIFVIRPVALIPLLMGSFAFMREAADQAGALSHGISINLQVLWIVLMIASCIKYYHHVRDDRMRELLLDQSYHDTLTGIANLRAFHRDMQASIGQEIMLVVLDLDDFKLYNDIHGHNAGDRILFLLASILLMEFDDDASPYRMYGDEFAIIAPADAQEDIAARIRRSRETLQRRALQYGLAAGEHPVSFSIGTAVGPVDDADSIRSLLHRADSAMYEEKQARRSEKI